MSPFKKDNNMKTVKQIEAEISATNARLHQLKADLCKAKREEWLQAQGVSQGQPLVFQSLQGDLYQVISWSGKFPKARRIKSPGVLSKIVKELTEYPRMQVIAA